MWLDTFGTPDTDLVFYVFCGVSGVILILSVLNILLGCCITRNRLSQVTGSVDFAIAVGSLMLCYPVIVAGLKPEWLEGNDVREILCKIYHVILLIGLTQFVGGLMVKGWTIFLFYKNNSKWIPSFMIWVLVLIIIAASMIWEFLFMPEMVGDECYYQNGFEWQVATSSWHAFLLLLAFISVPASCWATRGTPGSREANILAVVVVNTVLCVVAGICLWFLLFETGNIEQEPIDEIRYAVLGGLILWKCLFADVMLLVSMTCRACSGEDNHETVYAGIDGNTFVHSKLIINILLFLSSLLMFSSFLVDEFVVKYQLNVYLMRTWQKKRRTPLNTNKL